MSKRRLLSLITFALVVLPRLAFLLWHTVLGTSVEVVGVSIVTFFSSVKNSVSAKGNRGTDSKSTGSLKRSFANMGSILDISELITPVSRSKVAIITVLGRLSTAVTSLEALRSVVLVLNTFPAVSFLYETGRIASISVEGITIITVFTLRIVNRTITTFRLRW